ncbi:MAG: hypothetical protein ACOYMN_01495 [Roseimicrobium sp.]
MKRILSLSVLVATAALAEPRKFAFDAEAWAEGEPPKEVFVVEGKFTVASADGNKVLQIETGELVDANALLGDSANGNASIEVRVLGTKQGRAMPRFAIGVHGQSGYRLVVFAAQKQLQLTKGDEVIQSVPFTWTPGVWVNLKLEAKKAADGPWTIAAKAWVADAAEPAEPALTHKDSTLKGQGKCSIWGTPFSGTPILFDDIKIAVD